MHNNNDKLACQNVKLANASSNDKYGGNRECSNGPMSKKSAVIEIDFDLVFAFCFCSFHFFSILYFPSESSLHCGVGVLVSGACVWLSD